MLLTLVQSPSPPFGRRRRMRIVNSLIIESDDALILIDSGAPGPPHLPEALKQMGLSFDDFDLVINTHAHIDHVGHNSLCANADILITQTDVENESAWVRKVVGVRDVDELATLGAPDDYTRSPSSEEMMLFHQQWWSEDIYGTPKQLKPCEPPCSPLPFIDLVPTPGHTPGHMSAIVKGASVNILFAGDALALQRFFRPGRHPLALSYDRDQFNRSLDLCRDFKGIIIPGHDTPFDTETGRNIEVDRLSI